MTAWCASTLMVAVVLTASAVEPADGGGAIASDNWAMSIAFGGLAGGRQRTLTPVEIGLHPAATDSFDQGIDLLVPPPSPGEVLPTAYLFDPNGSAFRQRLVRDMRALPAQALTSLTWLLVFDNNSEADWTIAWDVAGLPDNWAPMRVVAADVGIDLDMRATQSVVVPSGVQTTFTIEATLQMESGVQVAYDLPGQLAKAGGDPRLLQITGDQPLFVNVADPEAPVEIEAFSSDAGVVGVELQDGLVVLTFRSAGAATVTLRPVLPDGAAAPSVSFPVTVLPADVDNDPPTVAPIRAVIMDQGVPMTVPIDASDPEGDPIFLSGLGIQRIGTAQGDETVPFVTADNFAAAINIEADNVAKRGARFRVAVGVSDGLHDPIRVEFLLLVRSTNARPAVSAPPAMQVEVGDDITIDVVATDPDAGDILTLTGALRVSSSAPTSDLAAALRAFNRADAVPAGGSFTKTLTYTATPEMDGTYVDLWWTADDGFASSSGTTTVVVGQVNLPPRIEPIERQVVDEGDSLEIPIVAVDPEGGPLTAVVEGLSGGASFDPNTFILRWLDIPFGAAGRHIFVGRLIDDAGNTTVTPIDITVIDVNQPPVIVVGDSRDADGVPAELTIVRGAESAYVVRALDADGDDVHLGVRGLPEWARGRRVGDRQNPAAVLLLEAPAGAEPFTFVLTATDSGGLSVEETVSVVIEEPANLPPRIEAPLAESVRARDLLDVFVPAADPDGDAISLNVDPTPSGLSTVGVAGGFQITWQPTALQAREEPYVLTLVVADEHGAEATTSFLITVAPAANRPPTGGDAVPVVVEEGDQLELDLLDGVFDPDGDTLTVELTTDLPPDAFSAQVADDLAVLTVAPEIGDAGAYTVEVTITDGRGGRLVQGWSIIVPDVAAGSLEILSTTPTVIESTVDSGYRFVAVITTPNDRPPDSVTITLTDQDGLSRELELTATGIGDLANGAVFAALARLPVGSYRYTVHASLDGEVAQLDGVGPRVGFKLVEFTELRALGRSGRIPFAYALLNPNPAGRINLSVEYRRQNDDTWTRAEATGDLIEVTSGVQLGFVWDSDADAPDAASEPVQIRVTPENGVPRVLTLLVTNVPPAPPTLDPVPPSPVTTVRVTGRGDTLDAAVEVFNQDGETVGRTLVRDDGTFAVTATVAEGINLLSAVATLATDVDENGPRSLPSEPVTVVVDPDPPRLAIVGPARGSTVATRTPTIAVHADFGVSGGEIDSAEMRLGGKPVPVDFDAASGVFTAEKELADLRVVLATFSVRKANGLSSSLAWTFSVDLSADDVTAPEIAAVRPSGAVRRVARVEAALRDGESGVDPDSIRIRLDGDPLTVAFLPANARSGLAVADIPTELDPGEHGIAIRVADRSGNETTKTTQFLIGSAVPPPALDPDITFGPTNSPTRALSGSAAPGHDVAVYVGDNLAGVDHADEDGRWSVDVTYTTEGVHLVQARARDPLGVTSPRAVFGRVVYDLTPPRVVLALPALGSVTGDLDPTFTGTVNDDLSGVDADTFALALGVPASSSYDADAGRFTAQADDPFADGGTAQVTVTVADRAGNVATLEGPVTFDARLGDVTPPAILSAEIEGATLVEGTTPIVRQLPATVTLTVVDDRSGVAAVAGLLDGDNIRFALDGDAATYVVDGVPTGEHVLLVRAKDGQDNTATVRRFTFAVRPALAAPTMDVPDVTSNPDLTITGRGIPPATTFRLLVNEAPVEVDIAGAAFTSAPARLQEGENDITAVVEDRSGTEARVSRTVLLDTQAPRVTFLRPLAGDSVGPDARTIRLRFDDNTGIDPASAILTVDGEPATLTPGPNGTVEYTAADPFANPGEERPHSARAVVRDTAGNVGSAGIAFVGDASAPDIEGLLPGDGEIVQTLEPVVSVAISDRDVDASTLEVLFGVQGDALDSVVDDPNFEYLASVGTVIYTPLLDDGVTYQVRVRVADVAGNAAERSWTFTVDSTQEDDVAPIVTILFPQPGQSIDDTGLDMLSFSLGDANGVDPGQVHLFVNDPTGSAPLGLGRLEDEGIAQFNRQTGVVRILGRRLFAPYQGARGGFSFDPLELNALERSLTGGEASFDPLELNALERSLSGDAASFDPSELAPLDLSLSGGGGTGVASSLERSLNTGAGLLGVGQNTIGVQVSDLSGNVSFASWSFEVSLDPPAPPVFDDMPTATGAAAISVTGHVPGLLTGSGLPVLVSLRVNDVAAGVTEVTETDGAFTFAGVSVAPGDNVMTATAQDNAGNLSDRSQTFTVVGDASAPVVTLTSTPSALPNPRFFLSGKVSDDRGEAPVSLTLNLNGEAIELTPALGSFSHQVDLAPGVNTLSVGAVDPAGNLGSSPEFTISIDVAAPTTAPASVTARPTTDGRGVVLSWPADPEASTYVVYRSRTFYTNAESAETVGADVATTSHTDAAVQLGVTYHYAVGSADAAGNTDPSVLSPTIGLVLMGEPGGTVSMDDGTQLTVSRGGLFDNPLQTATVSLTLGENDPALDSALDGTARRLTARAASGSEVDSFDRAPSLRVPVAADVDLESAPPIMRRLVGAQWAKIDSAPDIPRRAVTADVPGSGSYQLGEDVPDTPPWDPNGDGSVNIIDLVTVARVFGQSVSAGDPADTNGDGLVNIIDLVTVASHFGETTVAGAPSLRGPTGSDATIEMRVSPPSSDGALVEIEIHATATTPVAGYELHVAYDLRVATLTAIVPGDILPDPTFWATPTQERGGAGVAAVRLDLADESATPALSGVLARFTLSADELTDGLLRLREVRLSDARGELIPYRILPTRLAREAYRTALLPNYPNPFNPETWIPFTLKSESEVTVHVYDVKGARIRTLALGRREPGEHASREAAAYWDGRNERGEAAASGVYFIELQAGDTHIVRRMTVSK